MRYLIRGPGTFKNKQEAIAAIREIILGKPHPNVFKLSDMAIAEKLWNANLNAALNHPPLPAHLVSERENQRALEWQEYFKTHQRKEYDLYHGDNPTHRYGGIWTGD
ncbi:MULTISPECIES: hypothetical protein [unclassified Photorhabdus]|uniref:hypothetical protein n=1 Tax=unclassified Photorhabdus TaxID=2620880 RepID=UPI000DCB8FBE|nr:MULTISPECIES: hypothetical protein [unclassified Photorhabdus]RAW91946.1 hypothetical protein CKY05_23725 [Photorhabdus sp. S10-54]RAW91973.1 hypothetical protein CKY03_23710 [Photorhabdus sp. S9-53]RAW95558.1 hypothetical protein CKY04_23705 [Photorhabdus sp. S8-52]